MLPYYLLIIFTAAFRFVMGTHTAAALSTRDKTEKYTVSVFFVLLMLIMCFRDASVGTDLAAYIESRFVVYKHYPLRIILKYESSERLFVLLSKLITLIFDNPQFFTIICSLLIVIPIMLLYREEASDGLLCCSIFLISMLFEMCFSAIRQALAVAFVAFSFRYVKAKKPFKFLLGIILASGMHSSALVALVIYPLYHARITVKWLWAAVPAMLIVFFKRAFIFDFLLRNFGGKYLDMGYGLASGGYRSTGQTGLLLLFLLFAIYSYIIMDESKGGDEEIGLRNILLLSAAIQFFAPLHTIASRINYYFILFTPVTITRINKCCHTRYTQIVKLAAIVMEVFFVVYFLFLKDDTLNIFNYKLCF